MLVQRALLTHRPLLPVFVVQQVMCIAHWVHAVQVVVPVAGCVQ
jgi:hypothetical protein